MLIHRLDLGPDVREAFAFTYERWNGNGYPTGAKGEQIPLAMRVVHLCHDMEAIGRRISPTRASLVESSRREVGLGNAHEEVFGKVWDCLQLGAFVLQILDAPINIDHQLELLS